MAYAWDYLLRHKRHGGKREVTLIVEQDLSAEDVEWILKLRHPDFVVVKMMNPSPRLVEGFGRS